MKNADNMAKLMSLNNYVDEIEFGPWRNFISSQNLENQVKVEVNV